MVTDAREPNRNYKIPDDDNDVADEFPRVGDAITAIGADMVQRISDIAGKAPTVHTHTIAQVTGLQSALDGKVNIGFTFNLDDLSDVVATGAATYQVLMRVGSQWQPGTIDLTNTAGNLDAARLSGTIDAARIPVLASQATIISSGAISALTSPQQAQIITGTHVTTTDGRRWVYTGSGSKTAEASYIELADVTPEWSVVANKPNDTGFRALAGISNIMALINRVFYSETANFIQSGAGYAAGSTVRTFPCRRPGTSSKMRVTWTCVVGIERTASSGSYSGIVALQYWDGAAWQFIGSATQIVLTNFGSATAAGMNLQCVAVIDYVLDQTKLNGAGGWQIRAVINGNNASGRVTTQQQTYVFDEYDEALLA